MAAAGIMLLAALITAVTIRIRKADLAGVNPIKVGLAAPVAGEPAGDARPTAPRGSGRPLCYRYHVRINFTERDGIDGCNDDKGLSAAAEDVTQRCDELSESCSGHWMTTR
jgi:hypothetical protein